MVKKHLVLLLGLIIAVPFVSPQEAVLLDFSLLQSDTQSSPGRNENQHTMSEISVGSRTVLTSYAINNWDIELAATLRSVEGLSLSQVRETPSRLYGAVLGVRIFFSPEVSRLNTWARIRPPFAIPLDDPRFENGYGLIRDERGIRPKAISVYTNGLNYPVSLSLNLIFNETETRTIFIGDLNYEGWRELTWINPDHAREVFNNTGVYNTIRFESFLIRNDTTHSGDTVVYIRDIRIIYDIDEDEE